MNGDDREQRVQELVAAETASCVSIEITFAVERP